MRANLRNVHSVGKYMVYVNMISLQKIMLEFY
jgi:hypothetical protein